MRYIGTELVCMSCCDWRGCGGGGVGCGKGFVGVMHGLRDWEEQMDESRGRERRRDRRGAETRRSEDVHSCGAQRSNCTKRASKASERRKDE